MRPLQIFGSLILFLALSGAASAITCASLAYSSSCGRCAFDPSGKMDQKCYQSAGIMVVRAKKR